MDNRSGINTSNPSGPLNYKELMNDANYSSDIRYNSTKYKNMANDYRGGKNNYDIQSSSGPFKGLLHAAGKFSRDEFDIINKRYRFGINTPSDTIHTTKEYLFFTKPDLNIYVYNEQGGLRLNDGLSSDPYWIELVRTNPEVLYCLQDSMAKDGDHFNHLLGNMVQSNLSIPGLSSEMIDTPTNLYGVGYQYHGSAEASDDAFDFSLEFRDIRGLPVYHFFKAYEDYNILRHHGVVPPKLIHIVDKILYDQYSIYKFLVDEDGETLVYWAQLFGVKSKSLPREVFDSTSYDNGLSYSIDFNAAFFEDMRPTVIKNFNMISKARYDRCKYRIDIHNSILDHADGRPAKAAYIVFDTKSNTYKLRWRGDDIV